MTSGTRVHRGALSGASAAVVAGLVLTGCGAAKLGNDPKSSSSPTSSSVSGSSRTTAASASGSSTQPATSTAAAGSRTSCTNVLYVGESTSIGLVSPMQIPKASERLQYRMKQVGVTRLSVDVSGGRAAIGRLLGRPNTMDVLTERVQHNFTGCYFIALGVNDAADSAALHSTAQIRQRIDMVMQRTGGHRTLWPLLRTAASTPGFYADANMRAFNDGLRAAAKRYPNLRLYDWRSEMNPEWFEADGVHDRRVGSRHRAWMYARALAVAFPAGRATNPATVTSSVWGKNPAQTNQPKLPPAPGDRHPFWAGDTAATKHYVSGPPPA